MKFLSKFVVAGTLGLCLVMMCCNVSFAQEKLPSKEERGQIAKYLMMYWQDQDSLYRQELIAATNLFIEKGKEELSKAQAEMPEELKAQLGDFRLPTDIFGLESLSETERALLIDSLAGRYLQTLYYADKLSIFAPYFWNNITADELQTVVELKISPEFKTALAHLETYEALPRKKKRKAKRKNYVTNDDEVYLSRYEALRPAFFKFERIIACLPALEEEKLARRSVAWMAYYGLLSREDDEYVELLKYYFKNNGSDPVESLRPHFQYSLMSLGKDLTDQNPQYYGLAEDDSEQKQSALLNKLVQKYLEESLETDIWRLYASLFRQYALDITIEDLREYQSLMAMPRYKEIHARILECEEQIKILMMDWMLSNLDNFIGIEAPKEAEVECSKKYAEIFSEYYDAIGYEDVYRDVLTSRFKNLSALGSEERVAKMVEAMTTNIKVLSMNAYHESITEEDLIYMNEVLTRPFFVHLKAANLNMSKFMQQMGVVAMLQIEATFSMWMVYNGIEAEKDSTFNLGDGEYEIAINAHAVDLGLSVKWADRNIGANVPEDYGGYYSWGETNEKDNYDWETYQWYDSSLNALTKYSKAKGYGSVTLESFDDVACVKWGGNWRMPTVREFEELLSECTFKGTKKNGITGYLITGPNKNSIFLPASGCFVKGNVADKDSGCYYWANGMLPLIDREKAYRAYIKSGEKNLQCVGTRVLGMSIRPVAE